MSTAEATTVEKKELKPISDIVDAYRAKIDAQLEFKKNGEIEQKIENVYLELAKEAELDKDTIQKVRTFDENFNAAANLSVGMGMIPVYVEDEEVKRGTVTFKLTGRDKLVVESTRHSTAFNQQDRENPHQIYGAVSSVWDMAYGNKNAGQYSVVSKHVKAAASAALKAL